MPLDWALAFTTAGNAIKLTQDLRSIDKEMAAAEYRLKIADLTTTLADLKMTLTDAREEVIEKEREIEKLKQQLTRRETETVVESGYRYLKNPDGSRAHRPYCPVCEQKDGALIPTQYSTKPGRGSECPRCHGLFMPGS